MIPTTIAIRVVRRRLRRWAQNASASHTTVLRGRALGWSGESGAA
jgi:hypothetical protein